MASTVWETLEQYGLVGRIMAINCDNATNNDTMMDALEKKCNTLGIPFSARVARMRCMPHTVHLAALQLLETIGAVSKLSDDGGTGSGHASNYQECVTTPLSALPEDCDLAEDDVAPASTPCEDSSLRRTWSTPEAGAAATRTTASDKTRTLCHGHVGQAINKEGGTNRTLKPSAPAGMDAPC
ncbi:hypothetical protein C8Q80DRAFT_499637 [Daedaleopsis nitida]|nr:hypothetical protein C8Q80DRAFT_499637 [Daedaleopsis nitida]